MTDINPQNFEKSVVEQDIERVGKEVGEKIGSPEYKDVSEKEIIKEVIQPVINPQLSGGGATPSVPLPKDLPNYLKDSSGEEKIRVESLVSMALEKGLDRAAKEARQSTPFILDAFHDALTDKLYEELKNRKII